ncbi:hypothetical protein DPA88_02745 [Salmonella enterica subsp. salamae]|uniref:Uncharacterized protein n=1 Tax=Salmonella enterica subsp. salamae TaxID=59202 RepID=A0A5Y1WMB3_SALER|nr:hypothetical protein [Salmonella enterica subsp. enterica serovar Kimberley]ECC1609077.1 hypothetical protein [Salmonella enterica subsp. salamae]EDV4563258.1 hypothetical protein [Salmonella enterica subsp. enterica]EGU8717751.1 hypothetical protein [Salmonella enterica]ECD9357628.1 hypothetical protein [Salmonella enterica subsp. salamae]
MEKRFRVQAHVDKPDGRKLTIVMMSNATSAPSAMSIAAEELRAGYQAVHFDSIIPVHQVQTRAGK